MKIDRIATVEITPTAPFAFDSTFHKPDHFTSGDNAWEPGTRWQTWNWKGNCYGLKFQNIGTVMDPRIRLEVYGAAPVGEETLSGLVEEIRYRYNLYMDLSGFYHEFQQDAVLGPVIQRWQGMRPGHPNSLYEYLMIGIVLQNATVRRSIQMYRALLETFGTPLEYDGKCLWALWEPGALLPVTEEALRALKVGYRAKSIKKIDDYFAQGVVDELAMRGMDRETQRTELLKLYGVGPATVWYLLFDVFHRWDFFNHVSPWEQKIYSKLFFDQDPDNPVEVDAILAYFEKFGSYKQLAVHYIWEDLWWKRKNEAIPWLEKLIRV